jgi:hypothetical protein
MKSILLGLSIAITLLVSSCYRHDIIFHPRPEERLPWADEHRPFLLGFLELRNPVYLDRFCSRKVARIYQRATWRNYLTFLSFGLITERSAEVYCVHPPGWR